MTRKPTRTSHRRPVAPPEVPVTSQDVLNLQSATPTIEDIRTGTDLTDEEIRRTLEAAYT
jgi:hypothetical protein